MDIVIACYQFLSLVLRAAFEPLPHDIQSHPGHSAANHDAIDNPVNARFALKSDRPLHDKAQNGAWRDGRI